MYSYCKYDVVVDTFDVLIRLIGYLVDGHPAQHLTSSTVLTTTLSMSR